MYDCLDDRSKRSMLRFLFQNKLWILMTIFYQRMRPPRCPKMIPPNPGNNTAFYKQLIILTAAIRMMSGLAVYKAVTNQQNQIWRSKFKPYNDIIQNITMNFEFTLNIISQWNKICEFTVWDGCHDLCLECVLSHFNFRQTPVIRKTNSGGSQQNSC